MAGPGNLGGTSAPAPLRGRESECVDITAELDSARLGGRSVVVVVGAGGTGKTHLLRTVLADATRRGMCVATVLDGAVLGPEAPFPDAPHRFLDGSVPDGHEDVPRLMVVDNAHLADPERLDSLVNTALVGGEPGVLLILTGRSSRCGVTVEWLPTRASPDIVIIKLGPLSEAAVRDMITDLTGATPSTALAAFVEQANGNPRMVYELVTGLRDERRLRVANGFAYLTGTHTPDRATILIRRRLGQLSLGCRQLLQVASVLGHTLNLARIAEALHEPTASTLPLLEEAITSEILTVQGDRLVFQSTLAWRAVHDTVPVPIRMALEQETGAAPGDDNEPPLTGDDAPVAATGEALSRLSDGERVIAELVSAGLTNRQIAAAVFLSPHTVNYHLRRIFRKLNIASRVELAMLAKSSED